MSSRAADFLAVEPLIPTIRVRTETASLRNPEGCDWSVRIVQELSGVYMIGREIPFGKRKPRRYRFLLSDEWASELNRELLSLSVPVFPAFEMGEDGEFFELSVGEHAGKAMYRWWSCPPEGWRGLAAFAQKILDVFDMLRENYDAKLDSRASRVFMECDVAGLSHVDDLEGRLQGIGVGSGLMLRRDSTNHYDAKAIEVLNDAGERIGFVPRTDNSSLAGLMDQGLHFTARVQSLTGSGRHSRRLRILVFCERDAQRYFKDIERIEGTHV